MRYTIQKISDSDLFDPPENGKDVLFCPSKHQVIQEFREWALEHRKAEVPGHQAKLSVFIGLKRDVTGQNPDFIVRFGKKNGVLWEKA